MIYERIVLRGGRDDIIKFLETALDKQGLKYVRSPKEYRISIYPQKQKWRPFGFFLGYGYKSLPNSPIIDIILLEGGKGYIEIVFRIVRGFENWARRIIKILLEEFNK